MKTTPTKTPTPTLPRRLDDASDVIEAFLRGLRPDPLPSPRRDTCPVPIAAGRGTGQRDAAGQIVRG
jgi:hypothetical protein